MSRAVKPLADRATKRADSAPSRRKGDRLGSRLRTDKGVTVMRHVLYLVKEKGDN